MEGEALDYRKFAPACGAAATQAVIALSCTT